MLIELINTSDIDLENPIYHQSISHILCAYREGKHLVIAEESFLGGIASCLSLGNLVRNTAQNLLQQIKQFPQLKNSVNYFCKVDYSINTQNHMTESNENNFFTVSFPYFNDSSKIQKTKLLCEDINDYKLYSLISNFYKLDNKARGIEVIFDVCNGGGANTKHNFDQILSFKQMCLCLLDSDRKHPCSGIGSTASKFSKNNDTAICKHYIIDSHEIESLIPLEVIEICIADKKLEPKHIPAFEQLSAVVRFNPSTKLYYDHKEGITINKAILLDQKYHNNFWQDSFANAPNFRRKGCLSKMECNCVPECFAIPGFGTGLLDAGASTISKMSHFKLKEMIPNYIINEWNKIGQKLFSWGCSPSSRARTS